MSPFKWKEICAQRFISTIQENSLHEAGLRIHKLYIENVNDSC